MSNLALTRSVNPHYARRRGRTTPPAGEGHPRFGRLPAAPRNGSPVPRLTSLYHWDDAGPYGDRRYPGNCAGNLIKDLLLYFRPSAVLDSMSGSGTCADVCRELRTRCHSGDIRHGQDACDLGSWLPDHVRIPFAWLHPPYWRMKSYTSDSRDLSAPATLEEFLARYEELIAETARVLEPGGKMAVLMGDYSDRDAGYVPLVWWTKEIAFRLGLEQRETDVIRFSHGASSSRRTYRSSFIPGLHDVCMLFTKGTGGGGA